ncbi:MAG TPA: type II toxin-antitoxin system VapB family antitoxin [Anaerolineae bacterium]|nr:type II toxin-antitoxin system VapB family antitoxin [Anaerolineae bacterium]
MRTNIVLDDYLVAEAMQLSGIGTKREVVDAALRAFVTLQRQRAVLALEGTVSWQGDLDALRTARFIAEEGVAYDASTG